MVEYLFFGNLPQIYLIKYISSSSKWGCRSGYMKKYEIYKFKYLN